MLWIYIVGCVVLLCTFMVAFGAPYVPSHKKDVLKAFDYYKLSAKDVLIDVGSGDGLILRLAARRGAKAIGYEINPILVLISRLTTLRYPNAKTLLANFWYVKLPSDTTIVYVFGVSRDGKKLAAKMQREANRLDRPLKLLCYGSPLKNKEPDQLFEAYLFYSFHPLHPQKAQV